MPTVNWGALSKSQDDPETIEEAIARIVQEHDDDESAHLDTGQSLQSHKASEIIDHLALSIVEDKIEDGAVTSDKITSDQIIAKDIRTAEDVGPDVDGVLLYEQGCEMWYDGNLKVSLPVGGNPSFKGDLSADRLFYGKDVHVLDFASLDAFDIDQPEDVMLFPGSLTIATTATLNNMNYVQAEAQDFNRIRFDKNPTFRVRFRVDNNSAQWTLVVMGSVGYGLTQQSIGIFTNGTDVKFYRYKDGDGGWSNTLTGLDPTDWHTYEVIVESGNGVYLYVDGVFVLFRDDHVPEDVSFSGIFTVQTQTQEAGTVAKVYLLPFTFSQDF